MQRLLALTLMSALGMVLAAQVPFYHLAPTDRGDLYFSSSFNMKLRGPVPPRASNVFHLTLDQRLEWFTPDWGPVRGVLHVSGDGTVFASTLTETSLRCVPATPDEPGVKSSCTAVITVTSRLTAPRLQLEALRGSIQLSRNGRYALLSDGGKYTLFNLLTASSSSFDGVVAAPSQALTGEGAVLLRDGREIVLRRSSGDTRYVPACSFEEARVSEGGDRIVYGCGEFSLAARKWIWSLRSIALSSGEDLPIAEGATDQQSMFVPKLRFSLSNDGTLALYVDPEWYGASPQVHVVRADSSERRRLTSNPQGIYEAAISGDGTIVYAVTYSNRLIRIDVRAGAQVEAVQRTPMIEGYLPGRVPGSLSIVRGSALSDETVAARAPLPVSLGGVKVRIGELDARMIEVAPREIRCQIPFETPLGPARITVSSDSPFEQERPPVEVTAWDPWYLDVPAIHRDTGAPVTLESPARPGEVVNFYAVGLGPVAPPVATGQPGPGAPPSALTNPIGCTLEDAWFTEVPLNMPFAGLAPGWFGVYPLSVQVPDVIRKKGPAQRYMRVACGRPNEIGRGALLLIVPEGLAVPTRRPPPRSRRVQGTP